MTLTRKKRLIIGLLLVILMINYMVITVVLKDTAAFKYLRDILLLVVFVAVIGCVPLKASRQWYLVAILCFGFFGVIGALQSDSLRDIIIVGRRYIFPLIVFFVASNLKIDGKEEKILRFFLIFLAALSLFGVIQAHILGEQFLINLGYPLTYSQFYKRDFLGNSFYFGGLNIQRVVATLSSSNICALVLGITMVYLIVNNKVFVKKAYKPFLYLVILLGYLLTFSRSNFVALFVVLIFVIWKYIPYRRYLLLGLALAMLGFVAVAIIQGEGGIANKIFEWVVGSFQAKDTSAAGRSGIWMEAFEQVKKSPFGIGFGHVGGVVGFNHVKDVHFSAENSYLAIALDTGWGGLICYIGFLTGIIAYLVKNAKRFARQKDYKGNRLCVAGYATAVYLMVVMFFSNHIHDMEAMALAYFLIGISVSYARRHQAPLEAVNE